MNIRAAIERAEAVDRKESARADAPTITKVVTKRGRGWGFWGKGRMVSVWLRPDGQFQVLVFRPRPMCLVKEFVTKDPPRTAAESLAIEV